MGSALGGGKQGTVQMPPPGVGYGGYPQQQMMPQQTAMRPQPPGQYQSGGFSPMPQANTGLPYPGGSQMPGKLYPNAPQNDRSYMASYNNDLFLAGLTGWSVDDISRLRREFSQYVNPRGVIDRNGFLKLYVASLLNMSWEAIERDAETAFRNFDVDQTGGLDFNEYITACSRMIRETGPR